MSSSSSILSPPEVPHTKSRVMPVLHTNVEDPSVVRWSKACIPCEHQKQDASAVTGGEDSVVISAGSGSAPARRKQTKRNDSVSHCTRTSSQWFSPIVFDRQGWINGSYSGRWYYTSFCVMMAFKITRPPLNVSAASTMWESIGVATVPRCSIVCPVWSIVTRACHCTVLRYAVVL